MGRGGQPTPAGCHNTRWQECSAKTSGLPGTLQGFFHKELPSLPRRRGAGSLTPAQIAFEGGSVELCNRQKFLTVSRWSRARGFGALVGVLDARTSKTTAGHLPEARHKTAIAGSACSGGGLPLRRGSIAQHHGLSLEGLVACSSCLLSASLARSWCLPRVGQAVV